MNLHDWAQRINFWRTREGVRIPVAEMTDAHIRNVVRMFGRTPNTRHLTSDQRRVMLDAVINEGLKRGILDPWA